MNHCCFSSLYTITGLFYRRETRRLLYGITGQNPQQISLCCEFVKTCIIHRPLVFHQDALICFRLAIFDYIIQAKVRIASSLKLQNPQLSITSSEIKYTEQLITVLWTLLALCPLDSIPHLSRARNPKLISLFQGFNLFRLLYTLIYKNYALPFYKPELVGGIKFARIGLSLAVRISSS